MEDELRSSISLATEGLRDAFEEIKTICQENAVL